jgi:hypothetical protein
MHEQRILKSHHAVMNPSLRSATTSTAQYMIHRSRYTKRRRPCDPGSINGLTDLRGKARDQAGITVAPTGCRDCGDVKEMRREKNRRTEVVSRSPDRGDLGVDGDVRESDG